MVVGSASWIMTLDEITTNIIIALLMEPHGAPSPLEIIIMVINCIAQNSLFFSNIGLCGLELDVMLSSCEASQCTGGQEKRVCTSAREQQLNLALESVNRD